MSDENLGELFKKRDGKTTVVQVDDGSSFYFSYHILEKKHLNNTLYELHVSCHIDDVNIKEWKTGDDELECRIGFYYN